LLNKEYVKKQPEQRALSAGRNEKSSKKTLSNKKTKFKSEKIHQLNPKQHLDFSSKNLHFNLPEFIHFQSDHLVLTPKLISHPLRNSPSFPTNKFNRQSIIPQTTTGINSPTKRTPRPRHSYDTSIYYEKQQQQKYSIRSTVYKFDSMSCFNEVRRLVIFFFVLFIQAHDAIYCLKENNDEHESIHISRNKIRL
jgi:hypothetical protein